MTTLPLIQDCVLIAAGTIGFSVTGEAVLAGNLTDAVTAINVNADAIAYVLGDEGSTYSGAGSVEPIASDRAAWNALHYSTRHTNDVDDSPAAIHHTLGSNADQAAAGNHTHVVAPGSITLTDTHILVGNGSNVAADVAMSNDATIANTGALTLATVNGNVGTFGSATQVSRITVNAKGLITAASNVGITSGHVIQDEGATLPTEPNLNFSGSGVIASDDAGNTATLVTIEAAFHVYNEIQIGTGGTTYYLVNEAEPDTVRAYVNGIRQPTENGSSASDVVTFSVAPNVGDTLIFDYELAVA